MSALVLLPEAASARQTRAAFVFIFITVLLDMLALGIIVPVLPGLVVFFRGGDTASAAAIYGVFASVWAAMQFLFSPILGSLSDRFGRRKVILLSNAGLGLDYLLMALAPTLGWLFVGRVASGITSSSFPTAIAYIADVTPPEERAAKFGLLGAAFGAGFIVGPTVGGLLSAYSLRESLPDHQRSPFHWRRANPIGSMQMLRSRPLLLALASAGFLSMLAHDSLPTTAVLYAKYRYHWDERALGLVLGVVGVAALIVQAGVVGRLVAWLGERKALALGFLSGAVGMAIYGFAPTGAWFMLGVPGTALFGLANPALQSLMTREVGPSEQGQLQGANGSMNGIANMTAPLLFTQVFALAIGRFEDLRLPGAPFILGALLLVAACVVGWRATAPPRAQLRDLARV